MSFTKKSYILIATFLALTLGLCLCNSFKEIRSTKRELIADRFNQARREGNQIAAKKLYKDLINASNEDIKLSSSANQFYETLEAADALSSSGNLAGARVKYLEACAQGRNMHGENEPDEAFAMNSYALALENYGKYDEAEDLLRRAVLLRSNAGSKDHVDRFLANNLGNIYLLKGNYKKAAQEFEETIALDQTIQGKNFFASSVVSKLTVVFIKLDRCSELEPYFRPILSHESELLQEDPMALAALKTSLGDAYAHQGNYSLARDNYQFALNILQKNNIQPSSETSKSLDDMLCTLPSIARVQKLLSNVKQN